MAAVEIPEVMVTGQLIPIQEFDRVRNAVCLLKSNSKDPSKSWSGTGFFVNVKFNKKNEVVDAYCIMTNHHVYLTQKNTGAGMVAVFHHDSTEKESFEIVLEPSKIIAHSKGEDLDYVLIRVDQSRLESYGVKPILADGSNLPIVQKDDTVYIIQHPGGMRKHYSQDRVKRVNKPYIEYYADTLRGSSGSPVFVLQKSNFTLIALHSKGVQLYPYNWNKGVLLADILDHLHTGKVTKPNLTPGVPVQLESGVPIVDPKKLTKDPSTQVTKEDIILIAKDISDVWEELGRALGHSDSDLSIINIDNHKVYSKCYKMLIKWTQIKVSEANYGALAAGFAHPSVARHELITKYC